MKKSTIPEIEKLRDKMKKYKDATSIYPDIMYYTNDDGRMINYGPLQMKILDKLSTKGYLLMKTPAKELGNAYKASLRKLNEYGHAIRFYRHIEKPTFYAIFYPHKGRELIRAIYDEYPDLEKRPGHMKMIEVPIMRNLNKLGTIQYWRQKSRFFKRDKNAPTYIEFNGRKYTKKEWVILNKPVSDLQPEERKIFLRLMKEAGITTIIIDGKDDETTQETR